MNADMKLLHSCLASLGVSGEARAAVLAIVEATAKSASGTFRNDPERLGVIAGEFLSRSLRRREFIGSVADDAAWNMLLAVFEHQSAGRPVSISDATVAGKVAPTTAMRHVIYLEDRGVLVRKSDPHNLRRANIEMPITAFDMMADMIRGFCVAPPSPAE